MTLWSAVRETEVTTVSASSERTASRKGCSVAAKSRAREPRPREDEARRRRTRARDGSPLDALVGSSRTEPSLRRACSSSTAVLLSLLRARWRQRRLGRKPSSSARRRWIPPCVAPLSSLMAAVLSLSNARQRRRPRARDKITLHALVGGGMAELSPPRARRRRRPRARDGIPLCALVVGGSAELSQPRARQRVGRALQPRARRRRQPRARDGSPLRACRRRLDGALPSPCSSAETAPC